jgi:hypothetical protein
MLTALCVIAMTASAGLNDSLPAFPIGFWNYAPVEIFDEAKIQEWADAGVTLTMSPEYSPTPENIAHMKQILDWSQARNIKLIICDPRVRAGGGLRDDYAAQAALVTKDFGAHPAVFGFHILDEPGVADFEGTCKAVRLAKDAAPTLHPFVNLLPWYPGVGTRVGYHDWGTYLDDYLKKSEADFLCYDCYSQMNPDKTGWPMYFKNLTEYGGAARRGGVPFWTTILSVAYEHCPPPTEDDIRWQFNTAVAYGAQGIFYYVFYMRAPSGNYRMAPIDEFWDRTPVFDALKRTNKGFTHRYGRLFLDLTLQKATQHPKALPGCETFAPDDVVKAVTAAPDTSLIISRFADKESRPWIAVVNNSVTESAHIALTFAGAATSVFQYNWDCQEAGIGVVKTDGGVKADIWLAPGQLEIYRIATAQ